MSTRKKAFLSLIKILNNTDAEHPITAPKICTLLNDEGYIVDRRSIYRDIKLLIDFDFDIVRCSDKKQGFFMASHQLEGWEVKVLLDAVLQAKFITPTASEKLSSKLLNTVSIYEKKQIMKSTYDEVMHKTPNKSTQINIALLLEAISSQKKISFSYCKYDSSLQLVPRRIKPYIANPYTLHWDSDFYYLLSTHGNHDTIVPYRLDRMINIQILEEDSRAPKEFINPPLKKLIEDYMSTSTHHYGGNKKIVLKIEYSDFLLDHLVDEFGKSSIHAHEDSISIETAETEGLYFWMLQYGKSIKILSPEHVKNKYLQTLNEIMDKYK